MECEKCGSDMWDNRRDKRNPRSPDYKCKDKGCGHGVWTEPRGGNNGRQTVAAPSTERQKKPHATTYLNCLAVSILQLAPKLKEHGFQVTTENVLNMTTTLFIEASKGGSLIVAKAAPTPPPPPPPPPPQDDDEDPDFLPF